MRVVMSIIALWSSYNAFIETDMSSVDFLKGQSCCPLMYWCIICEKVNHGLEVERSHQIVLGLLIILTPLHEELIHQSDSLHSEHNVNNLLAYDAAVEAMDHSLGNA